MEPFEETVRTIRKAAERSLDYDDIPEDRTRLNGSHSGTADDYIDYMRGKYTEYYTEDGTIKRNYTTYINRKNNTWPICCAIGIHRGDHLYSENITVVGNKEFQEDCHALILSEKYDTSCFCDLVSPIAAEMTSNYHRWDQVLLKEYKKAAEYFENVENVNKQDIPIMYVGSREGIFSMFPSFDQS